MIANINHNHHVISVIPLKDSSCFTLAVDFSDSGFGTFPEEKMDETVGLVKLVLDMRDGLRAKVLDKIGKSDRTRDSIKRDKGIY